MRHVPLPVWLIRTHQVVLRAYWKAARPNTFGVKVLLVHPQDRHRILAVRHSYGDTGRWGLPGGGYRPRRESVEAAAAREVGEELHLELAEPGVCPLHTEVTTAEGKRDTVTILTATPTSPGYRLATELAEARWVDPGLSSLPPEAPRSRWLHLALAARRSR